MSSPRPFGHILSVLEPHMFRHWDMMNPVFLRFADLVLQGAGYKRDTIIITSDWRSEAQQQALSRDHGGAKTHSLHEDGQAIDLRMPRTINGVIDYVRLGSLVDAICLYRKGIKTEFEIELTPSNPHLHLAQWVGVVGPLLIEPTYRGGSLGGQT